MYRTALLYLRDRNRTPGRDHSIFASGAGTESESLLHLENYGVAISYGDIADRKQSEERDLAEYYRIGVNAYVMKPVRVTEFVDAVKHIGMFWAIINEPPPGSVKIQ